ncbi:unnamed protein product [Amaranthus hypochondriacus]
MTLPLLDSYLPLPPEVFDSVSSIYHGVQYVVSPSSIDNSPKSNKESSGISSYWDLIMEFEDAMEKQRPRCMSNSALAALNVSRFETKVEHRLAELEG